MPKAVKSEYLRAESRTTPGTTDQRSVKEFSTLHRGPLTHRLTQLRSSRGEKLTSEKLGGEQLPESSAKPVESGSGVPMCLNRVLYQMFLISPISLTQQTSPGPRSAVN